MRRYKKLFRCQFHQHFLCTNFLFECCFGSFFYVHVSRGNLPIRCSYKKFARKMLMKLTPDGNENKVCLLVIGGRAWNLVPDWAGPLLLLLQAHRRRAVLVGGKGQPGEGQSDWTLKHNQHLSKIQYSSGKNDLNDYHCNDLTLIWNSRLMKIPFWLPRYNFI